MKRLMILAAGFTLVSSAANAQLRFGAEAGLNLANMHTKVDSAGHVEKQDGTLKLVPKVGFIVDIPLTKQLSLQPGIFYSMKGSKREFETTVAGVGVTKYKYNTTTSYIEIPINFQYQLMGPHFFIGAGAYLAMAVDGHRKYDQDFTPTGGTTVHTEGKHEIDWGNDHATSEFRRTDYGVNLNIGYMLPMGLFFRAQYGLGLANFDPKQYNNTTYNTKNTVVSLTAGILLGGKKK